MNNWTEGEAVSGRPKKQKGIRKDKDERPLRKVWLLITHASGVFCLLIFMNGVGLPQLIANLLFKVSALPESLTSKLPAFLVFVILICGSIASKKLTDNITVKVKSSDLRSLILFFLPFFYLTLTIGSVITIEEMTNIGSTQSKQGFYNASRGPASESKNSIVTIKAQPKEGFTERSFTTEVLENLEDWVIKVSEETFKKNYSDAFSTKQTIRSESSYAIIQGRKIAIIKVFLPNNIHAVSVIGINGDNLYRITCASLSNQKIEIFSGECGREISRTFELHSSR